MTNVRGTGHPLHGAALASLRLAVRLRRPGTDAPPLSLLTQRRATALTWAVRYAHRGLMLWSTLAYYRLRACGAGPIVLLTSTGASHQSYRQTTS